MQCPELYFEVVTTADPRWQEFRRRHYINSWDVDSGKTRKAAEKKSISERGQQVHCLIWYMGSPVGIISGGSPAKNNGKVSEFFNVPKGKTGIENLKWRFSKVGIIDNTVYHLTSREPHLFSQVLSLWEKVVPFLWIEYYGIPPVGFETFIEAADTQHGGRGSGYRATGWKFVGLTKGCAKSHSKETGMDRIVNKEGKMVSSAKWAKTGTVEPKHIYCKWRPGYHDLFCIQYEGTWDIKNHPKGTPIGDRKRVLVRQRKESQRRYIGTKIWATTNYIFVDGISIRVEANEIIRRLQLLLSPESLKPEYRKISAGMHSTFGHCYEMTEALYHLYGKRYGFKPYVTRVQTPEMETTHWWLQRTQNGKSEILDPTKEQFESRGIKIPYGSGRGSGFLTGDRPSKRCAELIAAFKAQ